MDNNITKPPKPNIGFMLTHVEDTANFHHKHQENQAAKAAQEEKSKQDKIYYEDLRLKERRKHNVTYLKHKLQMEVVHSLRAKWLADGLDVTDLDFCAAVTEGTSDLADELVNNGSATLPHSGKVIFIDIFIPHNQLWVQEEPWYEFLLVK